VDYGYPLEFGAFITPVNDPPQAAVARARLAEQLGYDLVSFQDHPYQPGFMDTWTLLTWVAAQTETIKIAGNVLNIPMRPAPVLARAAASLDLLSGGRLALGLGAGGFWDAMEAMGVTRRTAAESVDQLSEAIDVIREIWAADERAQLKYEGTYYHLCGPSAVRRRRTRCRSGWAHTSPRCSAWSAPRRTAGSRRCPTSSPVTCATATRSSMRRRPQQVATRARSGVC
jgi:alkanesulfonate monooxygenase SsuD/methylene tetrahydromethanopterin reductase-like flavin-dependent oxidoreductase (luciferase family)